MPFFSKTCSQLVELGTLPHSAMCVGFGRTFFSRNLTFSGDFEKNNIRMIENVFMQYFFSSSAICWDRGKSWYWIFCWYIWCAWCVQMLLWCFWVSKCKNMDKILSNGVIRSSVRQNLAPVVLCKVEWFWVKIINFRDLKILKKFFHFPQKLARTDTSGFLS